MKDINIIRLKNASFYAFHGVANGEQDLGAKYEVDFEAQLDFSKAGRNDSLNDTLSYEEVYNLIKEIICKKKYYLIEKVTYRISEEIFNKYSQIEKLSVKVRKYHPPVKGVVEYAESEVIKARE
jgi:7,8-dihydroneopterin aldolase/epimerase/oxygenase